MSVTHSGTGRHTIRSHPADYLNYPKNKSEGQTPPTMVTKASASSATKPSSTSSTWCQDAWFPSWFVWVLFGATSAFRVYYVMQPKNWWTMHPDEIYQVMEVAHSEMYGYGFRAYEYSPVTDKGLKFVSHARQKEVEHGMAALRSFLLPRLYLAITCLLHLVLLDFTPFLAWKVAHTLVASTLPLAVFRYVNVVFRSHDTACIAAILCATCAQLHVLGTHTLVNSLLSPPVIWALSYLHTIISPPIGDEEHEAADISSQNDSTKGRFSVGGRQRIQMLNGSTDKRSSFTQRTHAARSKTKEKNQRNGVSQQKRTTPSGPGNPVENARRNGSNGIHAQEPKKGRQNAFVQILTRGSCMIQTGSHVLAGFTLGVCVYIRADLAAFIVFALLPHWRPLRTRYLDVISVGVGALCGIALGVLEDFRCYGFGVLTPYNWYRFNVANDYSALLFGREGFSKYVEDIFLGNGGMTALMAACCVCCVWLAARRGQSGEQDRRTEGREALCRPTMCTAVSWLSLLVLYSCKGHKELRFVYNVIVLLLITCAAVLQSTLRAAVTSAASQKCVLILGLSLFALNQWQDVDGLTTNRKRGGNRLAFKTAGDTQDINQCLYYISCQSDVTGLFMDRNLYATGGYPLLHKNVPIFTIFGNNFHEYRLEERQSEPATNLMGPAYNLSLAYITRFSNFVSRHNSLYVMKYVLHDPRYNYFIVWANRDFTIFGLDEPVFNCRTFKVYHRSKTPTKEQRRRMEAAITTSPPTNATVLLHEANMLLVHGAWARAVERFRLVLRVDPSRVGAYLPMAVGYHHLGDAQGYVDTMNECYARFSAAECQTKRPFLPDVVDYNT